MKKILITGYNLDIGGIETSLINLLKQLDLKKYEVTLVLEKKEGVFLEHVPSNIKVIDYGLCYSKNILYRKIGRIGPTGNQLYPVGKSFRSI